jgi:hypothetical protein
VLTPSPKLGSGWSKSHDNVLEVSPWTPSSQFGSAQS